MESISMKEENRYIMLTRRSFLNLTGATILGAATLALSGCGESRGTASSASASSAATSTASASAGATSSTVSASTSTKAASSSAAAKSNTLVLYFSHTGENYGVGVITEGNTAIVAKMIAEKTGADMFEIVPSEAYPEGYDACCDVALNEQKAAARPACSGDIDLTSYETIYLGYPIWWGDLPMCVYTFLEAHEWAGKDIHPFCTHAGSGLSGTVSSIQSTCAGSTVGEGLSIPGTTAQNSRDQAQAAVDGWIG